MADETSDDKPLNDVECSVTVKQEKLDEYEAECRSKTYSSVTSESSQIEDENITIRESISSPEATSDERSNSPKKSSVQQSPKPTDVPPYSEAPPPIDFASVCGAFGWTTIGGVHLPFLMRGEERFIAVRMVESKIISTYVNILPWTVFACTNIKSYYVTENEAKLLNEINSFHCDYHFGYQTFSIKDVVVRLKDTVRFYEFLESCRTKVQPESGNPLFREQCGFVKVNCTAIPYIRKGTKKYVLYNMVYQEGISSPVSCTDAVSEWDMAYFQFLSTVANFDQRYLKVGAALCSLDDLQPVVGVTELEEWWPEMHYSSKSCRPVLSSSDCLVPKYGDSLPFMQPEIDQRDCSKNLRDDKELHAEFSKYLEFDWSSSSKESPAVSQDSSETTPKIDSDNRAHLFPSSLESLLSASPPPLSSADAKGYSMHFGEEEVTSSMMSSSARTSVSGLSSLATSRPRPFPPPPPLVRLDQAAGSVNVPPDDENSNSSIAERHHQQSPGMQYAHPEPPSNCPAWMSGILPSEWMPKGSSSSRVSETVSRSSSPSRLLSYESWASVSSGCHAVAASSLSYARQYGSATSAREGCEPSHDVIPYRDERNAVYQHGSPRLTSGTGPPHHYPTPPQSSPLQPASFLECPPLQALTDLYNVRSTPNSMVELCSPPPSPDVRSAVSSSPRGSSAYQPHSIRLAQVDSRYVLAVNVEPYKHNSVLAVPISEVISKFLRDTSVESCQVALESYFGLQLYECTSLQQEAYAKHYVPVVPGSKMVSVVDLRNYLYQLRYLLVEKKEEEEEDKL